MASHCSHCGSTDVQANVAHLDCLACGRPTGFDGEKASAGMGEGERQVLLNALAPRQTNIVGNLADLQRAGAAVVEDGAKDPLVVGVEAGLAPGVEERVQAEKKAEEAVIAATDDLVSALSDSDDTKAGKSTSKSAKK